MTEETETGVKLEEMQRRIDALAAKNDELLAEVKAERAKRRETEEARQAAEDEARAKAEEAAAKSGDVDEVRKALEMRHAAALAKIEARAAEAEGQLNRYIIDGGIRDALAQAEIAAPFTKAAALLFKDGRKIEVKDGSAWVDGVPLVDAVKEWAGSDEVSGFKAAGQATGGGAPGGGKSAGKTLADMSEADRLKLASENPEQFRAMRAAG